MKRLFTLIILSILLCGHAFAYDFSAVCSTGQTLYYNITSNVEPYTVEVTSENASDPYYNSYPEGNLEIPETVEYNSVTYSVTSVGYNAFYGCNGLPEITIPNSVTRIGNDAFVSCSGLTSITIPESVASIGELAFNNCSGLTTVNFNATNCTTMGQTLRPVFGSGCTSLTTLNIGNNVTNIPKIAFDGCSGLSSVIIPNSVISIGNGAFEDCSGLTSVTIGNSVTRIGNLAFYGCSSLSEITIPNSVTEISPQAFASCSVLTTIAVEQENPIYDSRDNCNAIIETQTNTLIAGCMNTIIPNSVTSIGEYAFSECSGLASVTIPNSVTSIGSHAFFYCNGLTSVTIPNSVTSIGDWAFYDCSSLTSIAIGNSVASIGSSAFNNTGWYNNQADGILYLDNWCLGYKGDKPTGSLTITDGTNGIAGNAFSSCEELTGVLTIPASVTIIGSSAFSNCDGLTEISIGNSVASIGNSAFSSCSGLTTVSIPNSVTSIGDYAFSDCMGLTTVSIPNSVTSIGDWAFTNCSGLTTVNFNATNCTTMGRPLFGSGCTSLTTLNIGDNVTNIPAAAFSDCRNLTSVTIPNSVTSIGNNAFSGCTELTTLNFNARNCISMGSTGSSAVFKDCTSLATLNIGENVKNIPDYAFYNCSSLTDTLTIPDSVTNIGTSAFYNCIGLTTVNFNATNCTSLGTDSGMAFFGCTNITNVTFGNNVTRIPDYAFTNCSGIDSVSFPESVTSIGVAAFRGSSISEITIPTAVTSIDIGAITLCSSLSSVNFNATNCSTVSSGTSNSFSDIIFTGCPISNLTIGSNVETIPDNTFNSCTSLDTIKCYANNPPTIYANSFNFGSLSMNTPVLVSCSAKDAYENADLWNNFQNIGPNCKAPSTHNGHEYVDLGLSVKWATVNVGATSPEEEGNLYSWGGTETKSMYEWINYEHCEGYEGMINKYFTDVSIGVTAPDNLTTLLPEDDAVTASWGAGWRMPTSVEVEELINNCTIDGTTISGNGNSITMNNASYWTSSLYLDDQNNAYIYDNFSGSTLSNAARYNGYPVRGVYDATLALPTVITDSLSNLAATSVYLYGTVITEEGVPTATEFGFKYGTDSQSLTETIQGDPGTVGFTVTLTELQPGTTYYCRAYATNENGTGYGEILRFTTPQIPATVPYSCDFEDRDENDNWTLANGNQTNAWYISAAANNGGENGLYISNDGGTNNEYDITATSAVYAYRTLEIPESATYNISFSWKNIGDNNGLDRIHAILVPESINADLTAGNTNNITSYSNYPNGWINIYDYGSWMSEITSWQSSSKPIYIEAGYYKLVFYWTNNESIGSQPPAAIDNIVVRQQLEPFVKTLPASDANLTSAILHGNITFGGFSDIIERGFILGTNRENLNQTLQSSGTTDDFTYSLSGLTAGTTYYYRAYATNTNGTGYGKIYAFTLPSGQFTDTRDGNTYNYVTIGDQVWMAENLKYDYNMTVATEGETSATDPYIYYPNGDSNNVDTYGYLYNWSAAMNGESSSDANPSGVQGICPSGWHMPSYTEWTQLIDYLGGEEFAGVKLIGKAEFWNYGTIKESEYFGFTGFNALPAGNGDVGFHSGSFFGSATDHAISAIKVFTTSNNSTKLAWGNYNKETNAFSVRCVKNEENTASNSTGYHNNHGYVDLGLPSGTKWATCNVGATSPEGYGNYYAWGETETKDEYTWNNYRYCNGSETSLTKYCNNADYGDGGFTDTLTVLEADDDAATANWGGEWRMPTKDEMQELYDDCDTTWITQNEKNGILFTSRSNGNSIFLPATSENISGWYWSSSLSDENYPTESSHLLLFEGGGYVGNDPCERSSGFSIRPVYAPSNTANNNVVYSCDFEDADENANWTLANTDQTNQWHIGTAASHGGEKGLYISNDDGVSNAYGVSAVSYVYAYRNLDIDEDGYYIVSFDWLAQGESTVDLLRAFITPTSATLEAGNANGMDYLTVTTPYGWIDVANPEGQLNLAIEWQQSVKETYLDAGTYNLVFFWKNNSSSGTQPPAAIDNVSVTKALCPSVVSITVSEITTESASISWTERGSAESWEIIVSNTALNETQLESYADVGTATSTTYSATGLSPATTFYVYVRAACSSDEKSLWTSTSFISGQNTVTLPYTCDFENTDENNNWALVNGDQTNKWHIGAAASNGGSNGLYVTNDSGTSNAYTNNTASYIYAYRTIEFSESATYSISFDWKAQGEGNYDLLRAFIVPTSTVLEAGNANGMTYSNNSAPSGWTDIANPEGKLNLASDWQQSTKETYLDAGTYNLVFFWKNNNSISTQPPAAIDNVSIKKVTCLSVTNIRTSSITTSSAYINWHESANASSWEVIVSDTELGATALENYADATVVYDSSYNATGLNVGTKYYAYIRAVCSDSDKSLWQNKPFRTKCNAITVSAENPYSEDFNSYSGYTTGTNAPTGYPNHTMPDCWEFANMSATTSTYPQIFLTSSTTYAVSGLCLLFKASSTIPAYAVLPTFSNSIENLSLEFTYKNEGVSTANGTLHVGISNDISDLDASYVDIKSFEQTTTKTTEVVNFATETALTGEYYIVFKYVGGTTNNYYMSIDDVSVRFLSSDAEITAFTFAEDAEIANINSDAATITSVVAYSTADLNGLVPTITVSDGATISPESGVAQDFTSPVTYTVTAENGTTKEWTVSVSKAATASPAKDILSFTFNGQVGESVIDADSHTITAYAEWDYDISNIIPTITISQMATISPASGTAQDFTYPVSYTVTAEDLSSQTWTITILPDPNACPNPEQITVSNITGETATLSWQQRYIETSYNVKVSSTEMSEMTATADIYDNLISSTTLDLTGLTRETTYYVYVQSACGNDEGWVSTTFTTIITPATIPYTCDFEEITENDNWKLANGDQTNKWYIGSAANNGGENGLYISNDDGVSNTYTLTSTSYVYAYRNFNIDEDGVYTVNFDWRAKGTGYYNLLRAFIVPTSVVLEAGTANGMASLNNPTPSGWIDIANPEGILNNKSEWQQSTKEIALDAGTYNLVFFWKNAYSQGNQPPAAIDNISITKTACPSVTNLRTTDITDEAVTLGWNENGEATSWEVIVSTEELTDDALESHEKETAADSSYLKTGLTALTKYYAYVRAACSADNNSLWKSTTFWTGGIPVVTTLYTDTRTNTTATLKAKAISTEDVNYTFYYGTDRNNMSVIADATPTVTDSIATIQLSNLNPEVWYYYTAEATNSYGTVRGDTLVFLTCGQITDDRDGNQYYTIQIGDQKWMAQNLKYVGPEVSLGETTSETEPYYYYVNGNEANTDTYGYLYNWPAAMNGESSSEENPSGVQGICPNGWHLPSDAEWTQLTNAIGGFSNAGAMMIGDSRLWQSGTNLTISPYIGASGFNALPAGFYDGSYSDIRYAACFWSSTANTSGALLRRIIYASPSVISNRFDKYDGFSIRCVKGTTIYAYDTINYCGEQYTFGTQTLTANGDYQETFSLGTDKDSVVYLHLTMYPTLTATISYSNGCYGANNGFVEVSADGGAGSYTYNWNTTETQTTALVNNLGAGEYSVTISDAAGCTATFSQTLTTPTELTASINGNNPNCYDDETTLEAIVSGGSPDYTYAWNTSETTESIIVTPTATTSYTVTVTDANDCSVEASKNVTVPSELTVSVSCNTAIQCFGGTTDLTANPEGGSMGYTYTWSNDATNPIITEVGAGDYSVTITDGNGCTATTSTNVSQPDQLTNEISHTACESYEWNGTTYTETGDFQQTFANVNGCDSVVTLHLTISNTLTTEISNTACDSYQWNDSTYYASGEYIQTFYTGDGCDSIVTLHLTINGSTTGEFAAQMCSGVPYEYNGQTFDEAGTYYVTLVNANGCDSIVTLTLTYANNCNRTISGIITDASTGNAIPSAKVTVGNMITWTNNAGEYSMPVTNGNIAFRVAAIGYASFFEFINIQSDTIINVALDFPLLQIDNNNITITTYPYLESSDTLTLENNGNATLVWSSITEYDNIELLPEDEEQHQRRNSRSLWDSIQTFTTQFNAEQAIATDGFFIYTSSWQRPGEFNRYTPDGEYIETFFVENVGMIRNLSYDGTYFYATEANNIIFKLDLNNQILVDSITTDISNIRHCSFDRQNGNLLAGDWNSLYSIDTASGTSTQIRNDLANVYSSAFDNLSPGGPYLWLFSQTSQDNGPSAYIRQFNLNNNDYTDKTHYLDDIGLGSTSLAGGICASEQIKEGRFVLLANIQNPSGNNTIATYEIGRTNSIVTAEIKSGKIQPNESMKIVIHEHATEVGEFNSTIRYRAAVMGSQANDVNITVSAIAPECNAVQNITAVTDTFHTITMDWQPVELGEYDNVSYLIYRNDMQNDIDTISETSITYENISVGEHCFNVRAMFVGEHTCISNASDTVCAEIQDIPCNVTLTVDATNDGEAIFLTWNKPVGIEYFTIYRNDNTFDEVLYDSNYMDTNVVPEVTYCYTIFAHFENDACNELVTTVCTKIISGLCASAPELNVEAFDNSIVLNWTGSDDTYNYKIFRNNEPIGVTTGTIFYEKVARGFTYCYKVKSICDYGMFVYSDEKCIFVPETGDGENSIYEWTDDNLSVYPNPTYDQFFIEGQQIATVQIFNAIGQLVSEIENSEDERITINCNGWNPGLYNVQIISIEGKVATRKVSIFR